MKIAVVGAAGRTGRHIVRAVIEEPRAELSAALEADGHPLAGEDAGRVAGQSEARVPITSDLEAGLAGLSCVIDFSSAAAAVDVARAAASAGAALVVGTTALDEAADEALVAASREIPVVRAPNMSVGVNVVLDLLARASRLLGPGFDLEIFEVHHGGKVDSPSGTALRMAEVVASARGLDLAEAVRHGRSGAAGPRAPGEIGLHAARGGDVVGEHTAVFAGLGERVEIVHRAHSRDTFARGAVRAALWTEGRPPGLYGMDDVLGLEKG